MYFFQEMSQTSLLAICFFLFWTLTSIGMIFDKSSFAWPSEFLRSATFLLLYVKVGAWNEFLIPYEILIATFSVSLVIALVCTIAQNMKNEKKIQ